MCIAFAQAIANALNTRVAVEEAPISDPVTGASGAGCQAAVTGTGEQFTSPQATVAMLAGLLLDQGWTADPKLAADGPTGTASGFRQENQLCWADAGWQPDASADCPQDQPIAACQVAPKQQIYTVTLNCGVATAQTAPATEAQDQTADPLPSWNPGPAKDAILKFVADVTDPAGQSYVVPADRIAVFDNDGTLWTEKPVVPQAAFIFQRIVDLAPQHPEWQTTQPYAAVLQGDAQALANLSAQDVQALIYATSAGMTEEEFEAAAKAFLDTAKHPRFQVPYTQAVYQPMLELLAFLRANGFKSFIVSGGGADFMRVYSEEILDTPRDDVVGSSPEYKFEPSGASYVLLREPGMEPMNLNEMKPINIQRHIGRRPILAGGNSDGDLEMFQYTGGGGGPYLNLVIVHDDAEREYDYLAGADKLMAAAAQSPWTFVSMKKDFKTIFPTEAQPAPESQDQMVNPASANCTQQGGTLTITARGDGGEYGICTFEDNRQCEEWALFNGDCPAGGLKVTGYITPAAQYCAITGGTYAITGNSGQEDEQGACTFKDGSQCDVWDYYNGKCAVQ
jgi:putative hemolysin/phosphoglycolate phosphatase-like HAD superfamily hydrolase